MRPVNLIPQEQRRTRDVSRTGPLPYVIVGALFILLAGVVVMVLSSNQISERESELTALKARESAAQARAETLDPYAKFQQVQQQRTTTISELADGRFDWPRVLRQLSRVIPKYVVLGRLTGLAGQGVAEAGGTGEGGSDLVSQIKGPSLSMQGCAVNQKRVAALVAALHQIDGVTRVGLGSAISPLTEAGSSGGEEGPAKCTRGVVFNLAVAFDAAPASPDTSVEGETPTAPASEESSPETSSSETESSSTEPEPASSTKTEVNGSKTTVSKTTTVAPPAN